MRLWDKGESTDELVFTFCVGEDYILDNRLVPYDVQASQAHVRMLAVQGYLAPADAEALCVGLAELGEAHARGEWVVELADEDCHTALERHLTERLGEAGKRVHLGRSRNDQVLTALRLYLREALATAADQAEAVAEALDELAKANPNVEMPGYTHMQRAMPSSVSEWAGAFASEIRDDAEGLRAAQRRAGKNPLGTAAGYGTPGVNLDREQTTQALGFAETQWPHAAAQLSRGKAEAEAVFALTLLAQDYGRLAADLCLFATSEFAFVRLPAAFTTGSSIMPQKRNPDVFELLRAKSVGVAAQLGHILAITNKMTSGYHRDLQEIKAPLFRAFDEVAGMSAVLARAVPGIEFDAARLQAAMDPGLYAAERANRYVTEEGMSFRDAYRRVAEELAAEAKSQG
jgi:argininosuccinate lyase